MSADSDINDARHDGRDDRRDDRRDDGRNQDVDDLSAEQGQRLQRAWRRLLITQVLVLPSTLFIGLAINDRLNPPTPRPGHHPVPAWALWSLTAVLLLVVLPIEFRLLRRRFFHRATTGRALIISGDRRDIRRVYRSLRRHEIVADRDRAIAQAYVNSAQRQLRTGPWLLVVLLVLGTIAIGLPAAAHRPIPWLVAAVEGLGVVVIGGSFVQLRRALAGAREQGVVPSDPATRNRRRGRS